MQAFMFNLDIEFNTFKKYQEGGWSMKTQDYNKSTSHLKMSKKAHSSDLPPASFSEKVRESEGDIADRAEADIETDLNERIEAIQRKANNKASDRSDKTSDKANNSNTFDILT
jgi:hypothetical protein